MVPKRVAYLTPIFYQEATSQATDRRWLLALARSVVQASRGSWQVDVISYGDSRSQEVLEAGLTLRILPAVQRPTVAWDVLSWELPEALAHADLVHIYDIYTRSGEMGLLVAKLLCKPVCASDVGNTSSSLGRDLQIVALADRVLCLSENVAKPGAVEEAQRLHATGAMLLRVYQDLISGVKDVAA
jgi:hypothetical protein